MSEAGRYAGGINSKARSAIHIAAAAAVGIYTGGMRSADQSHE